ncbi:lysophospholipid acyltransferase family protein [Desulfoluna spongiiphila]|uniref:lysophospholipid acyltransferase family protein n=1 Tax=Desulfoluna spongiiphila TaxID=419481 RepID=UPI001252E298|nr:lysophospholipid acyltransferase family protein [Desulfoluna spongiiphila]VVS93240.1 phospholipid/glycerol acyltransferase [Desulfoluna spongiiphila]
MASGNGTKNSVEAYLRRYAEELGGNVECAWDRVWGRFGRFVYWPYRWLVVAPFLGLSTLVLAPMAVLLSVTVSPNVASKTIAAFWARVNSFVTPMWVDVSGREKIREGSSYVVVANHLSHYDIYVLYGWLGLDIKWVMKKELEKVPLIGWVCKSMGHIFIDRGDSAKAVDTLNHAREKVRGGTSVIFFPEGTRSDDGSLKPFKKGAFRFAHDLGLPILPVTIKGTRRILPKGSTELMPGGVSLVIHDPVDVTAYGRDELGAIVNRVRNTIRTELEEF